MHKEVNLCYKGSEGFRCSENSISSECEEQETLDQHWILSLPQVGNSVIIIHILSKLASAALWHVLHECSIRGLNDVYVPASGAVIHKQEVPVRMMEGGGCLDNTFCAPSQQVLASKSNKIKPLVLEKSELHYTFQGIIHEIITHDIPV